MIEITISKKLRNTWGEKHTNPAWQWCVDNFGPPEPTGSRWAWNTHRTFWFHHPEDAFMFSLTWA